MRILDMTDALFEREISRLTRDVQLWANQLHTAFGWEIFQPDNEGKPFPLARRLRLLWDYARGAIDDLPEWQEIVQELVSLLWCPVMGTRYDIPPSWWGEPLGYACVLAEARAALAEGYDLTSWQLGALGGVTEDHIRLLCRQGVIAGQKDGKSWVIPAAAAKKWLSRRHY